MKFTNKILLLILIPVCAALLFLFPILRSKTVESREGKRVKELVAVAVKINTLIDMLQKERSATVLWLDKKEKGFWDNLQETIPATDNAIAQIMDRTGGTDIAITDESYMTRIKNVLIELEDISMIRESISPDTGTGRKVKYYTEVLSLLINALKSVFSGIGHSAMSEPLNAFLDLIEVKEFAGRELTGLDSFLNEKRPLSTNSLSYWMKLWKGQEVTLHSFEHNASDDMLAFYIKKINDNTFSEIEKLRMEILNGTPADFPEGIYDRAYRAASHRVEILQKITDLQSEELLSKSIALSRESVKSTVIFATAILAVIAMAATLGLLFIKAVRNPMKEMVKATESISRGEYSTPIEITTDDEMGKLGESINRMIGDLKKSRDDLLLAKEYTDSIIRSMTDMLFVIGSDYKIQMANKKAHTILGYKEGELVGMSIDSIFDSESLYDDSGFLGSVTTGIEKILISSSREKIPVLFSTAPLEDESGLKKQALICLAQDISDKKEIERERKSLEVKMLANAKLMTLGEVATGVAHEVNQPLTYIYSFIQSLQDDLNSSDLNLDEVKEDLKNVFEQIERIVTIIRHLQTFGGTIQSGETPVNIRNIIDNTLLLINEKLKKNLIELKITGSDNIPMIITSPNQIEQVFLNLFQNAIDILENKEDHREISIALSFLDSKESVHIEFSDNGSGMEESTSEKIFEPFFTTKETGKGTGLGLSIIYGIIKDHNGSITCKSKINEGTTFVIELPVNQSSRNHS